MMNKKGVVVLLFATAAVGLVTMHAGQTSERQKKEERPLASIRVADSQRDIIEISAKEACERLELRLSELRRALWQDRVAGGITFEPLYIPAKCHQDVENALQLNAAMK